MSSKMKYDPKLFNQHLYTRLGTSCYKKLHQLHQQTTALNNSLDKMLNEQKKSEINWKHKNIKWQMKYSIFLTIIGIFLFYSTILRWYFVPDKTWCSDWVLIFNAGVFWSMACIIYRRRKGELKELFIDAI